MESRTADFLPRDDGRWQYEPKWDGFRALAFRESGAVDLRGKSGKPLGRYFPEVLAMLRDLPLERFVVDGEVLIEIDGRLSFDALQARLHPAESRIRKLARETPARLMLFDLLLAPDGAVLVDRPLRERRRALDAIGDKIGPSRPVAITPYTRDADEAERWLAGYAGTDGVVAKRLDRPYERGERAMVKVKRMRTADCVVGGFRYEQGRRVAGSLLLGLYDAEGRLDHVGFTSTFADADRAALTRKLEAIREGPGFTGRAPGGPSRWSTERSGAWEPVRPELVVEVRFDHVTGDRFRHGTKLLRWRPDKPPQKCTMDQIAPPGVSSSILRGLVDH
jgi:ATP-dependent DNA ligase